MIVPRFNQRGNVMGVIEGLQGLVPNVDWSPDFQSGYVFVDNQSKNLPTHFLFHVANFIYPEIIPTTETEVIYEYLRVQVILFEIDCAIIYTL